ncbi:hypothetical protein QJS10_CPA02g00288 [Acorus calamus]|uniref:Condensin-2 complex subunit G2 n=1 Tax=Acorus calamus TaxID=4465 RepID=A0AAV9FAD4_ACOCL|nr:hypothetical protein QJS10_CPA02g00288 [Acorus calamus]
MADSRRLRRSTKRPPPTPNNKKKTPISTTASADDLLSSAASRFASRPHRSSLEPLLSSLPPSLPSSLLISVSRSVRSFRSSLGTTTPSISISIPSASPSSSPPLKRTRNAPETLAELKNLRFYACLLRLCLTLPELPFSPSDLLPAVRELHDSLVHYEEDPALLSEVSGLCELWWREQLPGRESLIAQSVPFLLAKSLNNLGRKSDVRRVHALRDALPLLDFEDEGSIKDLRLLLVRCFVTPLYIKTEEGRRFLAFSLGLNGRLAKEALAVVQSQIPFGRKSVLKAYGDVVFGAWKLCERGEEEGQLFLKEEIEKGFLQGLIEGAIHAGSRSLSASARTVLGGFIGRRTMIVSVDKLLFRLAEPLLFRSLQVANSNVRLNALHLLLDLFPLEDPDATKEVKDTLLDRQFFLIERLLEDDCPEVRKVAVEGSCRILHLFWEVIPSPTVTKLLAKIIDDMSHDMCNEVRLATLNGCMYLLDNPQTHDILKALLPRLGHMLLDPSLSVRVALVSLLLAVRDLRTFQFHKVVGLDALLSSLANDHEFVAQKITRLLITSYFPSKVSAKEACSRCIALMKRSPAAGARFCKFAFSEGSPSKSLLELAKVFIGLALSAEDVNPNEVDGLYIGFSNICCSLSSEKSCKTALRELFSGGKLKQLLTAANTGEAKTSVIRIASLVAPDDLAGIKRQCMDLIINCSGLSKNTEKQAEVQATHKLMFSCGWFEDLFEVLTNLLQNVASEINSRTSMPKQCVSSSKRKKSEVLRKNSMKVYHESRKRLSNEESYAVAAGAAWQVKDLLSSVDLRTALLNYPIIDLAFSALRVISQVGIENCMHWESLDSSPVMAFMSLATHMSLHNTVKTDGDDLNGVKNNGSQCSRPFLEETSFIHSLNHLLSLSVKLFSETSPEKSRSSISGVNIEMTAKHQRSKQKKPQVKTSSSVLGEQETQPPQVKQMLNVMEIGNTILMYIIDASTLGLLSLDQDEKSFNKASQSSPQDSDGSQPLLEAFHLASDLLSLIPLVELCAGARYALRLVSIAKQWLPDLILGLGSQYLINADKERDCSDPPDCPTKLISTPVWLMSLCKIELYELRESSEDEEADIAPELDASSVFMKFMGKIIQLLKQSPKLLDAMGAVILSFSKDALEKNDFEQVLGLIHFVCTKLVGDGGSSWRELGLMCHSLKEIYKWIDGDIRDSRISEDGKQNLLNVKVLLESCNFWTVFEDGEG